MGSLPASEIDADVAEVLTDRGLIEARPDAPTQLWLTGRGRGVDSSTFDA